MDKIHSVLQKIIELIGFTDFSISLDSENKRFAVFINDNFIERNLSDFVVCLDHLVKLIAKKTGEEGIVFVDVNNYRKQREDLILELARAAARKAITSKQEISLPAMNAYERRLVHLELASRPDIKTESVEQGRERYVVVKPI